MRKVKVAVLISGSGSNLQSLIDAAKAEDYPAEIALVISNKANAFGLQRAQREGIATQLVDHRAYESRAKFETALHAALQGAGIEFVCLAGFMRVLGDDFVQKWQGRMINIHPSLLPKYRGLNTHARAIEAGEKEAGCTVHWVVPELDAGPIIAQAAVPIVAEDTVESLAKRVLQQEHQLYPQALKQAVTQL